MGIDAGFDMNPRLSNGVVDRHNWNKFIEHIQKHYKDDIQVEIKPNYINFIAVRRSQDPAQKPREWRATLILLHILHSSISAPASNTWNEGADQYGIYLWEKVNETIRSYEQSDDSATPTSIAHYMNGTNPFNDLAVPLFEIIDIPGKGKGLIARFNIPSGTRILCEKPLLTAQADSRKALETFLVAKLKVMPKPSQRQFLSLHNSSPGKYPFSGIFKTNALPCGSGSPIGGVYPTACFTNHRCMPNAHNSWNSNDEHETIHAIQPIQSGAEVTISYDHGGPSSVRQALLNESFGFACNCSGCTLPHSALQASDDRRTQIQSLEEAIGNPFRMMSSPHESLRDCYSLLQALKQEFGGGAGAPIARLYYDAFQISVAHGDQASASIFAERAYEARLICEGEDSPETLRMKSLALKPADHISFEAYSRKWQTTRDSVPKGLDKTQFNDWLFMQNSCDKSFPV